MTKLVMAGGTYYNTDNRFGKGSHPGSCRGPFGEPLQAKNGLK